MNAYFENIYFCVFNDTIHVNFKWLDSLDSSFFNTTLKIKHIKHFFCLGRKSPTLLLVKFLVRKHNGKRQQEPVLSKYT